jgi:hypothetical protein
MLTAMLLAQLLNQPATAAAAWQATVYVETATAVRADRHAKAELLGTWLNQLDGERIRAAAVYSPFADETHYSNPFEE